MHYEALLRLASSVTNDPPVAPVPDEILLEASLEDKKHNTSLRVVITNHKDDDFAWMWFAIAGDEIEDSLTSFVPTDSGADMKALYKTIFHDYPLDHPNVVFFLPLIGRRVRRMAVNESLSDADLLWYWFDMIDLEYKFQIGRGPDRDAEETIVAVEHKVLLRFLADLAKTMSDKLREMGLSD